MGDSAGHHGFGSFDNTLVLRGGGDSGASCEDKRERQMREVKQTAKGEIIKKFLEKKPNFSSNDRLADCVLLLDGFSQKKKKKHPMMTPNLHKRALLDLMKLSVAETLRGTKKKKACEGLFWHFGFPCVAQKDVEVLLAV